mmetsp:Transcript_85258/g.238793  ORF Transcript_85258/g.238793 Transcript_85258/m.238793 type:complete len:214 (+) Transcript_85258:469-1110(+)
MELDARRGLQVQRPGELQRELREVDAEAGEGVRAVRQVDVDALAADDALLLEHPDRLDDELDRIRERYAHPVVWVKLLAPEPLASVDDGALVARLSLLVAVEDHRDHHVHDHQTDEPRVADPKQPRQRVPIAEQSHHACVRVVDQALVFQDLVLAVRVEEERRRAPRARVEPVALVLVQVVHDLVPCLARGRSEQGDEGVGEVLEVPVLVVGV